MEAEPEKSSGGQIESKLLMDGATGLQLGEFEEKAGLSVDLEKNRELRRLESGSWCFRCSSWCCGPVIDRK